MKNSITNLHIDLNDDGTYRVSMRYVSPDGKEYNWKSDNEPKLEVFCGDDPAKRLSNRMDVFLDISKE